MSENIKAVVFDMDGLLLDSEAVYERAWRTAAGMWGISDIDTVHSSVLGFSEEDSEATLKKFYGKDFDAKGFWDLTTDISLKIMEQEGVPQKPHALDVLVSLKKSHPLALASSSSRDIVEYLMRKAGMMDLFDQSVCGNEIKKAKPEPEIYLTACRKLSLSPAECAAVEDSPNGIIAANRAGLKCVMIPDRVQPGKEIKPLLWHLLPSLHELEEIL